MVVKINADRRETQLSKICKTLGETHACYVLITCSEPSREGKMDVELHFDGDETLAAFLIENAGQVFDEQLHKKSK
jgi:hypothetical protein